MELMNASEYEFFLAQEKLPIGFKYPSSYIDYVSGDIPSLEPWHFFYSRLDYRFEGLRERYPSKTLVPFARRGDNDDVACFDAAEVSDNPRVFIIHDFASSGWEERGVCDDFPAWIELAKAESEGWKQNS